MKNLQLANDLLNKAKNKADQAEIFISESKSNKIEILNNKIETLKESTETNLSIRVIHKNKLGFAYTSDFDPSVLEETLDLAIHNSKKCHADKHLCFAEKKQITFNENDYFDQTISSTPLSAKIKLAQKIEEAAYKFDKRIKTTEQVSYSDSQDTIYLVNSNGVSLSCRSTTCGGTAYMLAMPAPSAVPAGRQEAEGENNEAEAGFGIDYVKTLADFSPEKIGQESAEKAIELLGAKVPNSQKIDLIFDPIIASEILSIISTALQGDFVEKGKSMFKGEKGKKIAADIINIIDDGNYSKSPFAFPFDGEGTVSRENLIIENGKLKEFLYDCHTAQKHNARSTGNSIRGSFKAPPIIGPTNFYLKPGQTTAADMIKSIKNGVYITRVMGLHTANPISGDCSLGAAGIMIEKGIKTYPIRGFTIAFNLRDLLKNITCVGANFRLLMGFGAPSVLVPDIAISGK